jgi:hypothetical protein
MEEGKSKFLVSRIYSPAPLKRHLLDIPLAVQVVEEFETFYGTQRFISYFPRGHYWFLLKQKNKNVSS